MSLLMKLCAVSALMILLVCNNLAVASQTWKFVSQHGQAISIDRSELDVLTVRTGDVERKWDCRKVDLRYCTVSGTLVFTLPDGDVEVGSRWQFQGYQFEVVDRLHDHRIFGVALHSVIVLKAERVRGHTDKVTVTYSEEEGVLWFSRMSEESQVVFLRNEAPL